MIPRRLGQPAPWTHRPDTPGRHSPFPRPAPNPIRTPGPPRWDTIPPSMTVCVAAVSRKLGIIVGIKRHEAPAGDWNSANVATMKTFPFRLAKRWLGMYAGWPSEVEALRRIDATLAKRDSNDEPACPEMIAAVEHAYTATRAHRIEATILSTFGMTHQEFMTQGRKRFGDEFFRELAREAQRVVLNTSLLVFGFDPDGKEHIFASSEGDGVCMSYDQIGFYAIGSGDWAATAVLYATQDCRHEENENEAVYRVCEAQFAARAASGVGSIATVSVLHKDVSARHLHRWRQGLRYYEGLGESPTTADRSGRFV